MMQGLRTLVLATRVLDEQQYQEWNRNYEVAASTLEDREARIAAVSEKIERDLELVGVTAIEDKLQEGVPQAINSLITAGIKVHSPPDIIAKCIGRDGTVKPHTSRCKKCLRGILSYKQGVEGRSCFLKLGTSSFPLAPHTYNMLRYCRACRASTGEVPASRDYYKLPQRGQADAN